MKLRIATATLVGLLAACSPAPEPTEEAPEVTEAPSEMSMETKAMEKEMPWIAADFEVPTMVEAEEFKIVPLGPEVAQIDYEAYMSSIDHLQKTFSRSDRWPHENISDADIKKDMETEQMRFENRESFAYAILTPDGSRERGCIYVYPSKVPGYDSVVRMWVTQAEFDAGFDEEFYTWAQEWMEESWPFERVAYPGRAIEWEAWDGIVAESTDLEAIEKNMATAETFIDAFYTFDPELLKPIIEKATETAPRILGYQGWAEGGNYKVLKRTPCAPESPTTISCPVQVQDDPVKALNTGFWVTDTFHITFEEGDIVQIKTSSNDQPIYYEARKWVQENVPELVEKPCADRNGPEGTPGDCARAMTKGYQMFYEATQKSSSGG